MTSKPIVVDLDGTLIKTDLLFETASGFATKHPFQIARMATWLCAGKSVLKAQLAKYSNLDPATLPYNTELVQWLREQKAAGRQLVLATASHQTLANRVASHLDLFDTVLATDSGSNLKAEQKRDRLVSHYGPQGFDYIGDSRADLSVWRAADKAMVVSSSATLIDRARAHGNVTTVFESGKPAFWRSLLKALRPHQWMKNLLVFVPLLASHQYGNDTSLVLAALAFLLFGMTSSSVYLLNDLFDVADDRHHARKRMRPFAAGHLSLLHGWMIWPLLLMAAAALCLLIMPTMFAATLATYFALTFAYSSCLKRVPMLDVVTLAGLYTLRIIAGAAAIAVPLSFWLLCFSLFIFLSLAFIKRLSELKSARNNGEEGKLKGRGYMHSDLELVSTMGTNSGYLAVLVLALYIQDGHTAQMYHSPMFIWFACPLLLYWISRAWLIAHRGEMHDDPVIFALKDKISWLVSAGFVGIFGLARFMT